MFIILNYYSFIKIALCMLYNSEIYRDSFNVDKRQKRLANILLLTSREQEGWDSTPFAMQHESINMKCLSCLLAFGALGLPCTAKLVVNTTYK